ncbi:MAG: hypothetical protein HON70_47895, partial [Lentisphaerae bacterium]|nr:hypothetical protein [Lentisphaerota bacterium]
IQGVIYYRNGGGIRSDTLALAARGMHTLRWAVYPLGKPDYYRFVNVLRERLGANFTVPGGFQFGLNDVGKMSDEALREMATVRGLRFISSGVWFDWKGEVKCYHGHHMLKAATLRATLKEACAKVRRVLPEVKSLIYIHSFINTDPDSPGRFADSRVTLEDGGHYQNASYTKRIGIPFLYYYPAADNSYVAGMKEVIDMCLDPDRIGADGIYWDELDMMSQTRTFDRWDSCSAILDEKHRIRKTFGNVHLLARQGKVELVKYIHGKGGILIANSAPTTATLARVRFPRFVETAQRWYPARAHLYTPIALGDHHAIKTFVDLVTDIRLKLMWGSLYYYYSRPPQPYPTITQHMFPFTPIQLHRGWLLGKERILTAVPGTFTFGDTVPVRVYWYDAAGKLTMRTGTERIENGRRLVRLPLAQDEMAAIERK